ncbi:WD40 repeat domain-containing protein [uncultured Bartonella sp.]|uniref:WD40 repeat domain-containing protein n=1 Tax=uncultured Bartonella sp. TaxID=104108 RepID=UPI0026057422|nr:WD40 repeat domain-containing protein [uncultured Bartonella sp.]
MPTIAHFDLDSHCLLTGFLEDQPVFVTASGEITLLGDKQKVVEAHEGIASAALATDKKSLITGGEDGRICRTLADASCTELAHHKNKWITSVATGPNNAYAFGFSRTAWADGDDGLQEFSHERSVEDLAFAPKGLRLAVARYNGVTLHWLGGDSKPTDLEWKGAHFAVTFSPDNRYVISSMQENALHGWRLSDELHLRMSGYPTKVKSWSWSAKGKWLATSGAPAAIVWPFQAKDGPMGKAPLELGTRADAMVSCVCCHPEEDIVAAGFNDGMILFIRFSDAKEVLLRRPGKGAISTMAWDDKGCRLAFGAQSGEAGIIDISA